MLYFSIIYKPSQDNNIITTIIGTFQMSLNSFPCQMSSSLVLHASWAMNSPFCVSMAIKSVDMLPHHGQGLVSRALLRRQSLSWQEFNVAMASFWNRLEENTYDRMCG